jgi:hypothetical protein
LPDVYDFVFLGDSLPEPFIGGLDCRRLIGLPGTDGRQISPGCLIFECDQIAGLSSPLENRKGERGEASSCF